ncbi:MAG: ABC transporter ATP-binding protein [Rhodothermales bacterium]
MTSSATATDASAEVVAPLLEVRGVHKSYPAASGGSLDVLQGADLEIYPGEMVAVVGESGTGKSTLLHILGALDRPDTGEVTFRGESVFAKDDEALAAFRNRAIGFVFQFHHLLPEFTALENVCMPALIQGETLGNVEARALELLDTLGLADRSDHRPSALSGGEKQRVAIARALMNKPGLVLADEPTGNLDTKTADVLHQTLKALSRSTQQSFVIVTHNLALAALADRALRLDEGRIETVAPDEVKLWTRLVM